MDYLTQPIEAKNIFHQNFRKHILIHFVFQTGKKETVFDMDQGMEELVTLSRFPDVGQMYFIFIFDVFAANVCCLCNEIN